MYKSITKPFFDYVFSIILIFLFSPIIITLIILLYLFNKGKVFYFQKRPGINSKPFILFKFKTMNDICDINGNLLPDNLRITKLGKFIRSYSLDELLQLFNVLRGDMSFVGPRPLLMKYLNRYSKEQLRRQSVMPGITGWSQINGRNSITWKNKLNLDVYYVDNQGFLLDLKILIKTIFKVILRKDINSSHNDTMKEFKG